MPKFDGYISYVQRQAVCHFAETTVISFQVANLDVSRGFPYKAELFAKFLGSYFGDTWCYLYVNPC